MAFKQSPYNKQNKPNVKTIFESITIDQITLILAPHLSHGGARYFSKQYSQYKSPFSSTKPMSASGRLQL